MKKLILTFVILITPYLVNGQTVKNDLTGKIAITLYGGMNIPTGGNYSSTVNMREALNPGSQFTIGLSYYITKGFGIEGSLGAGYNYYKDAYKPAAKDPLWVNLSASVNAIYNFGHMFKNPVIKPFIRAGIGSYQWERFEDGLLNGDITRNNNNHNKHSFGFTVGAGAEYLLKKNISIGFMVDYSMFFPKHEELNTTTTAASTDRSSHSYLIPQLKLTYYIPTWK
jgi:opacity protein-like surface antigen